MLLETENKNGGGIIQDSTDTEGYMSVTHNW